MEIVPDSEGVVELPALNKRDPAGAIENGGGHEDGIITIHSETEVTNEPMKTMAELAAEHAERERYFEQGSSGRSKPSRRTVRALRARGKPAGDESDDEPDIDEDEDLLEPPLTDDPSDPSPHRRRGVASSKTNARSSSKSTPKGRNKRLRSPDIDEGSNIEHDGLSKSKATAAGRRPRRTTARTGKREPRTSRTVSGSKNVTSVVVPVSDRVLRSRKVRV